MDMLDQVLDVCRSDDMQLELGVVEDTWAVALYDGLGEELKLYPSEHVARQDFSNVKSGQLLYQELFGFGVMERSVA